MPDQPEPLRAVSWRDLCPWLIIFRVFRYAASFPVLALATAAVLLTPLGWRLSERLFLREDISSVAAFDAYSAEPGNLRRWPLTLNDVPAGADLRGFELARRVYGQATGEIASVFHGLVEPFRQLFNSRWTLAEFAFFLFSGLWTLAVWAFLGGAMTRLVVARLATEQRVGLRASLRHALRKFPAYFLGPLFPLLGVLVLAAFLALFGLLLRAGDVGVLIAGVLWFVVLLAGFGMAYLLLGLLFGWPLMWVAVSAERNADFFEAVSRSYSYARQAPLKYLFYALVALLYGGLCWLLVQIFAEAVLTLGQWGVAWGAGRERSFALSQTVHAVTAGIPGEFPSPRWRTGATLIAGWTGLVRVVATAFAFSFFWSAFCAIYLLLRYDVDRREMDEVWLELTPPFEPRPAPTIAPEPESNEPTST